MESLNSICPRDDDNWNDFNRINNNNSFVIENPEPEPKYDKEMVPDFEMNQNNSPTPSPLALVEDITAETEFNVMDGSKN